MSRLLKDKQNSLKLPQHRLIHDEPTRWGSTYDMVERFCEQQQAVCAVLAEDRKKWFLMPKDTDMTTLETVRRILAPLSDFTDALSGEKETTISSVLPLLWKIKECLKCDEGDSPLALEMKQKCLEDFETRYEEHNIKLALNISTYLGPRFKNTFVIMEKEVKEELLLKAHTCPLLPEGERAGEQEAQASGSGQEPAAKKILKKDLKSLLCTITSEKRGAESTTSTTTQTSTHEDKIKQEMTNYEQQFRQLNAAQDPLAWWAQHEEDHTLCT